MSKRFQGGILGVGFNPLQAPNAPTNVTATGGDASASVSFTAPSNVGGSAITGYTVQSSPGGIGATGSASPITVSGLSITGVTGNKGSLASDYVLSATSKDVAATITPKTVSLAATKVYDGTTTLTNAQVTIGTGIDNQSLTASGATASDTHVATPNKSIASITLGCW